MKRKAYIVPITLLFCLLSTQNSFAQLNADAGPDQTICSGDSVQIGGNPTGPSGTTFQWSNSSSLSSDTAANPIAFPTSSRTYIVTVSDMNGRSATDQMTVTVSQGVTADAGLDQVICDGDTVQLGGNPTGPAGATYLWSNTSSLNSFTAENPLAFPTDTTTYEVIVSSGTCSDTDQVQVSVNSAIIADAGIDQVICSRDTIQLGGSPTGPAGATYLWTNTGSLDSSTVANPMAFPIDTVAYVVTVSDGVCSDSDEVVVNVSPPVLADAGLDQTICNGDTVELGGIPTGPVGTTFQWSNSGSLDSALIANPKAFPTVMTNYSVTISNGACEDIDSVNVVVSSPMIVATVDSNVTCNGEADGGISTVVSGGISPYTFSWSNGDTLMSISGLSAATYTVSLTDSVGCVHIDSASIVEPAPVDTSVSQVGILLTANASSNMNSFQWLDCNNGFTPIPGAMRASYSPPVNGDYAVEVTSDNGCVDTSVCFNVIIVGIDEMRNENTEMKLYPNPTKGNITLELGDIAGIDELLFLYSINGQLIDQRRLTGRISKLDLNELETGVYFIRLGKIVRKVVISR